MSRQKKYVPVKVSTFHLINGIFSSISIRKSQLKSESKTVFMCASVWMWLVFFPSFKTHMNKNNWTQKSVKKNHMKKFDFVSAKETERRKKHTEMAANIYAVLFIYVCMSVCFFTRR